MTGDHRWGGMRRWAGAERRRDRRGASGDPGRRAGERRRPRRRRERKKGPWWGWGDTKRALEHLFYAGRRRRDPPQHLRARVLRSQPSSSPRPCSSSRRPSHATRSSRCSTAPRGATASGTAKDLADYFRLPITVARPLIDEMADDGMLERVTVDGLEAPGVPPSRGRSSRGGSTRARSSRRSTP